MQKFLTTRGLRPEDANDIARIAASAKGFTIPSPYMVWMLSISNGQLSRVLRTSANGLEGYLLAVMCEDKKHAFVWQFAISPAGSMNKIDASNILVEDFIKQAIAHGITGIYFTSQPHKIRYFNTTLEQQGCTPAQAFPAEIRDSQAVPTEGERLYYSILPDA